MVQVRCPECGYLQRLSEERFLSISEDFLNCPHCNARVPKQWGPCNSDHVPEEARHKMSAFASRILNGGLTAKEVVHALESLVRRYGPLESSYKALGVGYTKVGDFKKAEEFLNLAKEHDGPDIDLEKHILEALIGLERYDEARGAGFRMIQMGEASSDDIARTAIALLSLEEIDEANDLLKAYPIIDTNSAAAKQLKRQFSKVAGTSFGAKLKEKVNLKRILGDSGKEGLKSFTERAKNLFVSGADSVTDTLGISRDDAENAVSLSDSRDQGSVRPGISPKVEYWIYSPESEIPKWDDVKRSFGKAISSMPARARAFKLLESLIASNDLNIEYILRTDAEELFDYPEDLVRLNSRDFSEDDMESLARSQMIVRMELNPTSTWGPESLKFIVGFVEGLRDLTDGLVQDAVSHTLWGHDAWMEFTGKPLPEVLADHLHLEALDEDGSIWLHTHGMLKFGLPDIEIEGIPTNLKKQAQDLIVMSASALISRKSSRNMNGKLSVLDGAVLVDYEYRPADEEGHFPDGVFSLRPYVRNADPDGHEALEEVLTLIESMQDVLQRPSISHENIQNKARWTQPENRVNDTRNRIIEAHRKAMGKLEEFRKSFNEFAGSDEQVHAVKVGFPSHEGKHEWMWVSLAQWNGHSLTGRLENSPNLRTDLYKGCPVEIAESDIFDWVISSHGKILDGAFTESIRG